MLKVMMCLVCVVGMFRLILWLKVLVLGMM